jgi:hypothetical protein
MERLPSPPSLRVPLLDAEATFTGFIEPAIVLPGDDGVARLCSRRRMWVVVLMALVCFLIYWSTGRQG